MPKFVTPALMLLMAGAGLVCSSLAEETKPADPAQAESSEVPKELFTGKVVLLGEALKRKGIVASEEMHKQPALETSDGQIIPLVADWRGRAFFQDERLRNRKVQLVGMRKPGVPYLQVLVVYTFDQQGQRMYTDYWCDICSIPMYEIKPCDCCQGDVRLRFQPQDLPDYLPESERKKSSAGKTSP
jgi:hypothetical protein